MSLLKIEDVLAIEIKTFELKFTKFKRSFEIYIQSTVIEWSRRSFMSFEANMEILNRDPFCRLILNVYADGGMIRIRVGVLIILWNSKTTES